jgi:hypothetical protein
MQSLLLEDYRKNSKKPFVIIGLAVGGVIVSFIIGNILIRIYINFYIDQSIICK